MYDNTGVLITDENNHYDIASPWPCALPTPYDSRRAIFNCRDGDYDVDCEVDSTSSAQHHSRALLIATVYVYVY